LFFVVKPLISEKFVSTVPIMASVEALTKDALALPTSSRTLLLEKLLASLEGQITPEAERATLDEVRRRRAAAADGKVAFVDGPEALEKARAAVRK
jgi:hypothetical protein